MNESSIPASDKPSAASRRDFLKTSTVVVSMQGGSTPQRYVFAVGEEERFSLLEMPYLLGAAYRIHERKF